MDLREQVACPWRVSRQHSLTQIEWRWLCSDCCRRHCHLLQSLSRPLEWLSLKFFDCGHSEGRGYCRWRLWGHRLLEWRELWDFFHSQNRCDCVQPEDLQLLQTYWMTRMHWVWRISWLSRRRRNGQVQTSSFQPQMIVSAQHLAKPPCLFAARRLFVGVWRSSECCLNLRGKLGKVPCAKALSRLREEESCRSLN